MAADRCRKRCIVNLQVPNGDLQPFVQFVARTVVCPPMAAAETAEYACGGGGSATDTYGEHE